MHPEELKAQKEIIQYNQEKMYPLGNDVKIKYKFEILDADGNAQFTRGNRNTPLSSFAV